MDALRTGLNDWLTAVNAVIWHDSVLYIVLLVGLLFTIWSGFCQYHALTHGVRPPSRPSPRGVGPFVPASAPPSRARRAGLPPNRLRPSGTRPFGGQPPTAPPVVSGRRDARGAATRVPFA